MSKLKKILKNRAALTLIAVVLGWSSLMLATSPPAYACPPCDVWYYYYTDSTYTVQCGYKVILSSGCGQAIRSGCQTPYYIIENDC